MLTCLKPPQFGHSRTIISLLAKYDCGARLSPPNLARDYYTKLIRPIEGNGVLHIIPRLGAQCAGVTGLLYTRNVEPENKHYERGWN